LVGGSIGGGAGRTGAAHAGTLTAAVGIASSVPATASVPMLLRRRDDLAKVIGDSVRWVPNSVDTAFRGPDVTP
jgi:hypothetical protein